MLELGSYLLGIIAHNIVKKASLHVRSPGKRGWSNTDIEFVRLPIVGEYVATSSDSPWYRVELVVHCPFGAVYVAEVYVVEVDHAEVMKQAFSEDVIRDAQSIADKIIKGTLSPYDGGRRIWKECQLKLEQGDHRLDPFAYWASEYEDTSSQRRRALCDKALRQASVSLIENGKAPNTTLEPTG
jgi:hypothetical protein